MLRSKSAFELLCRLLKIFVRYSPDTVGYRIVEYKLRERIERTKAYRCCAVIEKLSDKYDSKEKIEAVKILAKWKKRITIPFLERKLFEEEDPEVRYWIVIAIGDIGGRFAAKSLIKSTNKITDHYVLFGTTESFIKLGKSTYKELLKGFNSKNPQIRSIACKVFCMIKKDDAEIQSMLAQVESDRLMQNLKDYCKSVLRRRKL